jgi:hypothetical protein
MSALDKMSMPEEIVEAIQASLPEGQVIRHVGLMFMVESDLNGKVSVRSELFLAVTDAMIAIRFMDLGVDLNAQQLLEKQARESELEPPRSEEGRVKKFKIKRSSELLTPQQAIHREMNRGLNHSRKLDLLVKHYGPIGHKWLPQITHSFDFFISEVIVNSFKEGVLNPKVAQYFKPTVKYTMNSKEWNRRSDEIQSEWNAKTVGIVQFTGNNTVWTLNTLFDDANEIYDHIRNVKLGKLSPKNNVSQVTKCINCGSTELSVSDGFAVCDFCQSKFSQ